MSVSLPVIAYLLVSYLVGAFPTGYIVAKRAMGIDIREHGSGNVGSTNVKRVVGKKAGYLTQAIDILKGFFPVLIAGLLFSDAVDPYRLNPIFAGLAAVLGHSKSVFIGFSGGKSVNTSLGAILALQPVPALLTAAIALGVIKVTRIVSIGSMLGAVLLPLIVYLFHGPLSHVIFSALMGVYVIILHRSNIMRLIHRQENRI